MWSETERRARKAHRCTSCMGAIQPGTRYTVHFSKYDGETTSEKLCAQCRDSRQDFADAHGGMLPLPSYFPTLLRECIAEGDEESERRWKPMLEALTLRGAVRGT